jgi:hypothetical protein
MYKKIFDGGVFGVSNFSPHSWTIPVPAALQTPLAAGVILRVPVWIY